MTTTEVAGLTGLLQDLGLSPVPEYPEAHILERPLDIGRSYLADIIRSLVGCDDALAYKAVVWPNNISNGDFSVPLPKLRHGEPEDLGSEITTNYRKASNSSMFITPIPDGKNLRFMFVLKLLPRLLLPYIKDRGSAYGTHPLTGLRDQSAPEKGKKKVVIEFSSPNIGSEFQGKHLRSTIIGSFIANIHEAMGWDVVRLNYLGDWGKNMGLLAVGWNKFGGDAEFETNPVGHTLHVWKEIYKLFLPEFLESRRVRDAGGDPAVIESQGIFAERNTAFKDLEEGDEAAISLWRKLKDASVENYKSLYSQLGIEFDEYSGESYYKDETISKVEKILAEKSLSEESEGSTIVDMEKLTKKKGGGKLMIRDRNNSQTYALRELANIIDRHEKYDFDKMIYVVADDHEFHFPRIFELLEFMGMEELAKKLSYTRFSKVSKMADTVGNELTLSNILDHCTDGMQEALDQKPEKLAVLGSEPSTLSSVAISGLFAQELVARKTAPHAFDASQMTAFNRSSGPELQYWHKRLSQILTDIPPPEDPRALLDGHLAAVEEEGAPEANLLRLLLLYPEITATAYKKLETTEIMNYLAEVMDQLDQCFEVDEEDGETWEPEALTAGQLSTYEAARQVLGNAMRILGITPLGV